MPQTIDLAARQALDGRIKDCPHSDGLGRITVAKLGGHRHDGPIGGRQRRRGTGDRPRKLVRSLPDLKRNRQGLAASCGRP